MRSKRVLVAGVGNIFLSDDGFGVEVAQRMSSMPMPSGVKVADFGIRGIHLAYELLDGYDALVLVDAVQRGDPPGTISVIEPSAVTAAGSVDAHSLDPEAVLSTLANLGGHVERTLIVGCEPESVEEGIGLSGTVAAAVDVAVGVVDDLVREMATVAHENEKEHI